MRIFDITAIFVALTASIFAQLSIVSVGILNSTITRTKSITTSKSRVTTSTVDLNSALVTAAQISPIVPTFVAKTHAPYATINIPAFKPDESRDYHSESDTRKIIGIAVGSITIAIVSLICIIYFMKKLKLNHLADASDYSKHVESTNNHHHRNTANGMFNIVILGTKAKRIRDSLQLTADSNMEKNSKISESYVHTNQSNYDKVINNPRILAMEQDNKLIEINTLNANFDSRVRTDLNSIDRDLTNKSKIDKVANDYVDEKLRQILERSKTKMMNSHKS